MKFLSLSIRCFACRFTHFFFHAHTQTHTHTFYSFGLIRTFIILLNAIRIIVWIHAVYCDYRLRLIHNLDGPWPPIDIYVYIFFTIHLWYIKLFKILSHIEQIQYTATVLHAGIELYRNLYLSRIHRNNLNWALRCENKTKTK